MAGGAQPHATGQTPKPVMGHHRTCSCTAPGACPGQGAAGGEQRAWSCLKHPPAHPRHRVMLPHTELAPQHPWYPGRMRAAAPGGEEEEEEEQFLGSAAAGRHPRREFAIPQPCPRRWMHPGQHRPPPASHSSQPAVLKQAQSSPQGGRGGNAETAARKTGLQALPPADPSIIPKTAGVPTRKSPKAPATPHTAPGASRAQAEALSSLDLLQMLHGIIPSPTSETGLGGGCEPFPLEAVGCLCRDAAGLGLG